MGLIHIAAIGIPDKMNWDYAIHEGKLKPLKKSCHDCAITTGFYTVYADMLKLESAETQQKVLDNWFCHNNCNRACAGAIEYLKSNKES